MPKITWQPEFSVNIKIIDEQHKKFIDTINILYDAMFEGKGRAVLADVFKNLEEYITTHFDTEEDFMVKFSYPGYLEQKREHDKCISKVLEFKKQFDEGEVLLSMDVIDFLVSWLHKHLLEMDQKYKDFFHEKGLF